MFRIICIISTYVRAFTRRFMPTSVVLDWLRSRRGLKWGVPATLLAVPYFLIAVWCSGAVERGASGWLNLMALLCIWNAMKFIVMGSVSLMLLLKVRHQEKSALRWVNEDGSRNHLEPKTSGSELKLNHDAQQTRTVHTQGRTT